MADVNKSVEISYRADLKQLISQLQRMPGVTETEAKKMVAQLDRQFKRAERSAKKAAAAQSRSMRQVGESANKAAINVKEIGDQAGDLDRAFMGAAQAANLLNPALGEVVMLGSDAAAIFEAITLGLNALNPVFLGIAAVVGAAAGAFALLNAENEKRLDILTRLKSAEDENRSRLGELADIITNVTDRYERAREELALFTQQQSQLDIDRIRKTREINRATQADVDAVSERIRANEHLVSILQREQTLLSDMTDAEREMVKAAQFRFDTVSNTANIEGETRKSVSARLNLINELNKEITKEKAIREGIKNTGEETLSIELQLIELQNEFNREQEKEERRQEKIKAHREAIKNLDQLISAAHESQLDSIGQAFQGYQKQIDALMEQEHLIGSNAERRLGFENAVAILQKAQDEAVKKAIDEQNEKQEKQHEDEIERAKKLAKLKHQIHLMNLSGDELEEQKILDKYNTELDKIRELSLETEEYYLFQVARSKLQKQMDEELHDRRMQQIKTEFKAGLESAINLQEAVSSLMNQKATQLEEQLDKDIESTKDRYESEAEMIEDQLKMKQITEAEANRMKIELKRKEAAELHRLESQQQSEIDELRMKEFRLNQSASAANIAFRTAEAIMASLATYPGAPGIALAAAAGITGAVQLGTVLTQQPPTAHMGEHIGPLGPQQLYATPHGMFPHEGAHMIESALAPDEQVRTVLTGEAVLDRATVSRIGGEDGIRNLMNNGQSDSNVVILQPFRHVDRYNRSARQMRGRKASRRY